ncbi:hypothetical protein GCM10010472_02060 [Pseudonocardia halophobica]|uniref:SnoaL-like domain-containing protein n=1 Tax=Pseudonocardia halophobica TaxID=29401 RepID=A0A9W6KYW1_9PSEU|nr:nuclear transport factor 2 family protein [Pseudonocardia halophobica]GLL10546.1 hypothetical protein GCM10017577_16860 [Pseudonocardia halophobica]
MPPAFRPTTVEHLLAVEEIRLLVLSYSYRVDGGEGNIADLFTDDGVWDSSDNDHPVLRGRAELESFFGDAESRRARGNRITHLVLSPLILELDDDEARAVCSYTGQVLFGGNDYIVQEAGRYHDRYVRTPQGWRIRERVLEHLLPSRKQQLVPVSSEQSLSRSWP